MNSINQLTVNSSDTILMVIDIQDRLAPAIENQESIIGQTAVLIQIASALAMPIVTTEQYPRGLGHTVQVLGEHLAQAPTSLGIFEKVSFSACTADVMAALESTGRRTILMAGMETHVCIFQTVRDLQSAGYQVFLAQDAVGSRTSANRENGLELVRACGAVVSNVETLLFDLLKTAGTPIFKQLSRLIK